MRLPPATGNRSGKRVSPLRDLEARFDARFGALGARFDVMDARFDVMDAKIDARFGAVDARFESVDARFGELEARLEERLHAEITRSIRWTIGALFAGLAVVAGAATGIAAIVT
jgi:hypothetical protein